MGGGVQGGEWNELRKWLCNNHSGNVSVPFRSLSTCGSCTVSTGRLFPAAAALGPHLGLPVGAGDTPESPVHTGMTVHIFTLTPTASVMFASSVFFLNVAQCFGIIGSVLLT